MKNVHFSPVVSQLRYPRSPPNYPGTSSPPDTNDFGGDHSSSPEAIQRVTVQQVDSQKVQRIQVQIPPNHLQSPPLNHEEPPPPLFSSQLKFLSGRLQVDNRNVDNMSQVPVVTSVQNQDKIFSDELPPPPDDLEEIPPPSQNQHKPLINLKGRNGNTLGSLEEFLQVSESMSMSSSDNVTQRGSTGHYNQPVLGDDHEQNAAAASISLTNSSKKLGKKKGSSKSWLQWISFGKLGSGGGNTVKNCNGDEKGESVTKPSKRSSCPPLGHPLLLVTNGGDPSKSSLWSGGNGGGVHLLGGDQGKKVDDQVIRLTIVDKPESSIVSPKPSGKPPRPLPPKRSHSSLPPLHYPPLNSESDDEFSVNFERIIESIFDNVSLETMEETSGFLKMPENGHHGGIHDFGPDGVYQPADESLLENMEQKSLSSSPQKFGGGNHVNVNPVPPSTAKKSATIPVTGKPPKPPGMRPVVTSHHRHPHPPPKDYLSSSSSKAMLELAQKLEAFRHELHRSREQLQFNHHTNLDSIHTSRRHVVIPVNMNSSTSSSTSGASGIDRPVQQSSSEPLRNRLPSSSTVYTRHGRKVSTTEEQEEIHSKSNFPPELLHSSKFGEDGASSSAKCSAKAAPPNYFPKILKVGSFNDQEWQDRVVKAKEHFLRRGKTVVTSKSTSLNKFGGDGVLETDLDYPEFLSGAVKENVYTEQLPVTQVGTNVIGGPTRLSLSSPANPSVDQVDLRANSSAKIFTPVSYNGQGVNFSNGLKKKKKSANYSLSLQDLVGGSDTVDSSGEFSGKNYSSGDFGGDDEDSIIMATLKPGGVGGNGQEQNGKEDRSRSMEFLLDSEKNAHLRAPENTLQKTQQPHQPPSSALSSGPPTPSSERRMSEHELRIQRSLQKLNVPDWYKSYVPSQPSSAAGTPSKTRGGDFSGSSTGLAGGWPGLSSSKTNSLTSLHSASGRYSGSKTGFGAYPGGSSTSQSRHYRGGSPTAPGLGRSSRESLMSPSSTASASPSPNFERSSFTYGMPYALTRFAAARMSCGASPASLSPSPSPVGGIPLSSTSTPVSSGPQGASRYSGYQKQPYLGWRSQERLSSKSLYRSPAERLAQDLLAQQKAKQSPVQTPQPETPQEVAPQVVMTPQPPPPEIEVEKGSPTKCQVTSATASDLSLNNSEESNSHKLNRVRSSIKEVSNAIVDYVNESKPLDDTMNGRASPRRGLVWLESSFVGTKPIDSPGTPDTPQGFIARAQSSLQGRGRGSGGGGMGEEAQHFRFDTHELSGGTGGSVQGGGERMARRLGGGDGDKEESTSSTSHYTSYISRNGHESATSPTPIATSTSTATSKHPSPPNTEEIPSHHSSVSTAATYGSSSFPTDDPLTSSSPRSPRATITDSPSKYQSTSYHQYQTPTYSHYQSTTSASTELPSSEIFSRTSAGSYRTGSSSYQSDWQDRMNQPPPDSTFSYSATSRYSEPLSSPGSLVSSLHSTPTHQPYRSSSTSTTSGGGGYPPPPPSTSSCHSSPAKSILAQTSTLGGHHDSNELLYSSSSSQTRRVLSRDPLEEDELAFGSPTEIIRGNNKEQQQGGGGGAGSSTSSTTASGAVAPLQGGVIVNPLTGLSEYSNPPTPARHRRVSFDLDFSDKEEKSSSRSRNKEENVGRRNHSMQKHKVRQDSYRS